MTISLMASFISNRSVAGRAFLRRARTRETTSLDRFPSRIMRRIASRASARLGESPASHRRLALALVTMPESGWLTSWAMEAASSPMVVYPADMSQLGLRFAQGNLFLMQLFFGLLVFGAVHDDHREKRGVASSCGDEDRADVGPHYPAIFVQETLLDTMISSLPFVCLRDTGFG